MWPPLAQPPHAALPYRQYIPEHHAAVDEPGTSHAFHHQFVEAGGRGQPPNSMLRRIPAPGFYLPPPPDRPALGHDGRPLMGMFYEGSIALPTVRTGMGPSHTFTVLHSIDERQLSGVGMSLGVHLVRNQVSGKELVAKIISTSDSVRTERAVAEVNALVHVREAGGALNVNFLVEHLFDDASKTCILIVEHCTAGTIWKETFAAMQHHEPFQEAFVWHVLSGLAKALSMTHYGINADNPAVRSQDWNCIYHRDIKPGNIFLTDRQQIGVYPRIVLGDFGCAVTRRDIETGIADKAAQAHGTVGWFPPERFPSHGGPRHRWGKATDIWQSGAVVQTMCRLILQPDIRFVEQGDVCGQYYSKELNSLVGSMMDVNPVKRPDAVGLMTAVRTEMHKRGLDVYQIV